MQKRRSGHLRRGDDGQRCLMSDHRPIIEIGGTQTLGMIPVGRVEGTGVVVADRRGALDFCDESKSGAREPPAEPQALIKVDLNNPDNLYHSHEM